VIWESRAREKSAKVVLGSASQSHRQHNSSQQVKKRDVAFHFISPAGQIGGSAQRSIGLAGNASMPDRAENDFAMVRVVARVVPLRNVNARLNLAIRARAAAARRELRA
jgi:hypothetical protein